MDDGDTLVALPHHPFFPPPFHHQSISDRYLSESAKKLSDFVHRQPINYRQ
jgi:hypothetical protein